MVEIDKIRELVTMMVEHELTEVELRDGEECVVIKRGLPAQAAPVVAIAPAMPSVASAAQAAPPVAEGGQPSDHGLLTVRSPMVGTFYGSADPDASPFVSIGSPVEPDTIVCIIEAMKVFNEIKAELAGTIEQVLVRNEQAVEYGQPLFLVRPRT